MKEAMRVPEYYSVIVYLTVTGFVVPSLGSFGYYFMMDVIGLSKFTYSMLTVLGFFGLLLGTQAYHKWFQEWEFRTLVFIEVAIDLFLAPIQFMLIFRLNVDWGIPDISLILFTEAVSDVTSQCFIGLPFAVLIAKICPKRVEATSYAMLASIISLRHTIRAWIGTYVNDTFVGVTQKDLSHYWVLCVIGFVCAFIPLLFLWLIPSKQAIADL